MKARKFDEENLREVFRYFASYDGYELKVCSPDDLIPRLHAFIRCTNSSVPFDDIVRVMRLFYPKSEGVEFCIL